MPSDVAKPLQRELRAVGDLGAADEAFEQAYPRDEEVAPSPYAGSSTATRTRGTPVYGAGPLRLTAGRARRADGQQCGGPGRWHLS